jgi:hypothetical protein
MNGLTPDRMRLKEAVKREGDALATPGTLNIADLDVLNSVGSRWALIVEMDKGLRTLSSSRTPCTGEEPLFTIQTIQCDSTSSRKPMPVG